MSFAAGVLTAALALPPQGLVAAYDFARTNFVNWSEDLTQSAWVKTGVNVQAMTGLHPEGLPMYSVVETAVNADHRVDQSFSSTPSGLWFAEMDMKRHGRDVVSFGFGTGSAWAAGLPAFSINFATGQVSNLFPNAQDSGVSARHIGNGVYRVKFTARQAAAPSGTPTIRCWTGASVTTTGDGASGVLLTRIKVGFGTDSEYERTTDAQLLLDRSVRLWPAPAARTNLLSWSEELDLWSRSRIANVFTNATVAPNGTMTADKVIPDTTPNLPHALSWTLTGTAKGSWQTASCYFKAGEYTRVRLAMHVTDGTITQYPTAWWDVATGSLIQLKGMPTLVADQSASITPVGDGWYRCALSVLTVASASCNRVEVNAAGAADNSEYGGTFDGVGGWFAWGAMCNVGPAALPYERQTDGVVYDFSLKGRNLLANSDLTGAAGSAPTGWAAASAANISYGTDGSVTFTATTRFGAIHQAQQNLPVGGRPFTASMDLATTGGGRLLVYLYDHAGAYLTAMSSTTVNGRAVIQVNRTDVYRVQFRIEDERVSGWTPITFRQPMLELGLTDGGYQASARHATLGSSTGPDANDPAWTALGLSFDAADDFIAHRIGLMGPRTFIQVLAPEATTNAFPDWGQIGHTMLYGNAAATAISCNNRRAGGTNAPLNVAVGLTPGRPVFIAVSIQQGRQAAFVNGVRTYVATASDLQETDSALYYGTNFGKRLVGSEPPKGQQLYAAIYDRALTDAEITQAYRFIRNQLSRRGVTI